MRFVKGKSGNPAGRPRLTINTRGLKQIAKLAAVGVREKDIARSVANMSEDTWYRYKKDFPEVQNALDEGKQELHDRLVNDLLLQSKTNVVPALFLLKTRFNYREQDVSAETRPQIIINMRGALTPETYISSRRAIDVNREPALPHPDDDEEVKRG